MYRTLHGWQATLDQRMMGNIVLFNSDSIRFTNCEFAHLGMNYINTIQCDSLTGISHAMQDSVNCFLQ